MVGFPSHPNDVSPEWLSETIGAEVSDVRWQAIGTGQVGDSVRFELTAPAGSEAPQTLAAKFPAADETSRNTAAMMGLYTKEVGFYRDVAGKLGARVPEVHFADVDDDGIQFILLFEDLGPARGGNQIAGCSLADAQAAMRQAAAIHAPSWKQPGILSHDWLKPKPGLTPQVRALYPQAHAVWRERYTDIFEPEFMALSDEVAALSQALFPDTPAEPIGIVHGDFRLDNMLFDIKGGAQPIAVLDWQTVTAGNPMTDIGYFLGCGIGHDLRAAHEDELLDLYLAEMQVRGIALSRDEIWDGYRRGSLSGLTTAIFSAAFVERTERGDANFLSMARGACSLALEHGSIEVLKGEV